MLACVDVDYRDAAAVAACVVFRDWSDAAPAEELVEVVSAVEPYQPGEFYKRELPCLLAVLRRVTEPLEVIVVDGYVWLGTEERPGLGAYLYRALGATTAVIGVAKNPFHGAVLGRPVLRGTSCKPLIVTAAAIDPERAAEWVRAMHGPFRVPTLLKHVDSLCRRTVI